MLTKGAIINLNINQNAKKKTKNVNPAKNITAETENLIKETQSYKYIVCKDRCRLPIAL